MKKNLVFFFLFFCSFVYAQQYNSSLIDRNLLNNANLVLRFNNEEINIESDQKVEYKLHRVITVLNQKGNNTISINVPINSITKLKQISINIYDKNGLFVKKYGRKDMYEYTDAYENTLAQDSRNLSFAYIPRTYPYTIEYKYTTESKQSLFLPVLYIKPYSNCSIEKLNFKITSTKNNPSYTKQLNVRRNIQYNEIEDEVVHTYVDSFITENSENDAIILTKVNDFNLYGNKGSISSWQELGSFYFELNKNRNELPKEYKEKLLAKINSTSDTIEKIKILYKTLQDDYRYVSIQLGIGGWQSIDAATTYKNGYGDCKALSNLMCAMLEVAGIKSYVSLIHAKKHFDPIAVDFPMSYFNHVIVCVPLATDSIWLECTNNVSNFNYLNSFTANKNTLLVKPFKSELIRTPNLLMDSILSKHVYSITNTKLIYSLDATYIGDLAESMYSFIINNNKKEKDEFILNVYNVNNTSQTNIKIINSTIPKVKLELNTDQLNLINKNSKRLYIKLNKVSDYLYDFENESVYSTLNSYLVNDSIYINIPDNYKVESKLKGFHSENSIGTFDVRFVVDSNRLLILKSLRLNAIKLTTATLLDYNKLIFEFKSNDIEELVFILKD